MEIRRLSRDEIEKPRFDGCVHYAPNGNVFGYMWYLDFIAKDWEALVEDNYQSVFPLVYRPGRLIGKELHQPLLMRELGIYSVRALSEARIRAFLEAIPEEYRYIDITLNERNRPPEDMDFEVSERTNFQLMLNEPYEVLSRRYSDSLQARLDRASDAGLLPVTNIKPEAIAAFFKEHTQQTREVERTFHAVQRVMYNVLHRGQGFATAIKKKDGDLCAVNFYIFSHSKMLSLLPVASPYGREHGALELMTDLALRSNENRPLLLDFNTEAEAPFARDFGAQPNAYYQIKRDKRVLGLF
jgi:hypothetical protein